MKFYRSQTNTTPKIVVKKHIKPNIYALCYSEHNKLGPDVAMLGSRISPVTFLPFLIDGYLPGGNRCAGSFYCDRQWLPRMTACGSCALCTTAHSKSKRECEQ